MTVEIIEAVPTLEECEAVIARGLGSFVDAGRALARVRDHQLYRVAGFDTFDAYVRQRWGIARTYASRLSAAADIVGALAGPTMPVNEAQARELVPVWRKGGEDAVRDVWGSVTDQGEPLTADLVRRAVRRYFAPANDPDDGSDLEPAAMGNDQQDHISTCWVEVVIGHPAEYDHVRHERKRREWHSGRFRLPANVGMAEKVHDLVPLWKALAECGMRTMRDRPPTTAKWSAE